MRFSFVRMISAPMAARGASLMAVAPIGDTVRACQPLGLPRAATQTLQYKYVQHGLGRLEARKFEVDREQLIAIDCTAFFVCLSL